MSFRVSDQKCKIENRHTPKFTYLPFVLPLKVCFRTDRRPEGATRKATQNFKISDATPGFDIFNFLLPRDQIDVIPNLDVDVN